MLDRRDHHFVGLLFDNLLLLNDFLDDGLLDDMDLLNHFDGLSVELKELLLSETGVYSQIDGSDTRTDVQIQWQRRSKVCTDIGVEQWRDAGVDVSVEQWLLLALNDESLHFVVTRLSRLLIDYTLKKKEIRNRTRN